jgi:tRNA1(Val) A37 N6-methylase TrmN6
VLRRASPEVSPGLARAIAREVAARGGMSPDLPGRVYERERAADRGSRRAGAVYYTPPHLVDFAIDRALGPLLAEAGGDPLALRVLDPACGGAAFLLAALEYLAAAGADRLAILRRCLLGIDVDRQAAAVARLALAVAVPEATREDLAGAVRVADALEPGSAPAAAFDAVVTNPPWGQKRFALPVEKRHRYRELYTSGRGAIDPFALFVERAHGLLRPGGRWGMVLPDVVLLKNHEPLRALVLAGSELEWIAHAGRAFDGVNLDAVVITGRRVASPAAGHRVAIWHSLPETWQDHPPRTRRQPQAVFARLPGKRFNLHLDPGDLALLDRLAGLPTLGDRFEIHEGVHTGNARGKLFRAERPAGPCAPIVVGRGEVARYHIQWAGTWLDRSPAALDRAAGDYANLGRPEWHLRPKIVVRRTGDHLVAAWDGEGLYVSNNLFVVLPRARVSAAEQRAVVALLNSSLLTWCFRAQVPRVGRLFAELKIQHLAALPLAPLDRASVGRLDRLAGRRDHGAIDALVADLYRLSASERRRAGRV